MARGSNLRGKGRSGNNSANSTQDSPVPVSSSAKRGTRAGGSVTKPPRPSRSASRQISYKDKDSDEEVGTSSGAEGLQTQSQITAMSMELSQEPQAGEEQSEFQMHQQLPAMSVAVEYNDIARRRESIFGSSGSSSESSSELEAEAALEHMAQESQQNPEIPYEQYQGNPVFDEEMAGITGEDEEDGDDDEGSSSDIDSELGSPQRKQQFISQQQQQLESINPTSSVELTEADREIERIRERIVQEKLILVTKEIQAIETGEHPELAKRLSAIFESHERHLAVAKCRRNYQLDSAEAHRASAVQCANAEFVASFTEIKQQIERDLRKTKEKIEQRKALLDAAEYKKSIPKKYDFVNQVLEPKIELSSDDIMQDLAKIKVRPALTALKV